MDFSQARDISRNFQEFDERQSLDFADEALKMRSLCDELGYGWEDFNTFLNLHYINSVSEDKSIFQYLEDNKETFLKSYACMTNKKKLEEYKKDALEEIINSTVDVNSNPDEGYLDENKKGWNSQEKAEFADNLVSKDKLDKADGYLSEDQGTENFFATGMDNILKLYTDLDFRADAITVYETEILPMLKDYSMAQVEKSFSDYQDSLKNKNDHTGSS